MAHSPEADIMPFSDLAADCWRKGGDGWEEVDRLEREEPESLPVLIRALATSAPDGALSYIGVQILEDLAELAEEEGRDDTAIDVLIAAQLTPADTFEILAGPYPHSCSPLRPCRGDQGVRRCSALQVWLAIAPVTASWNLLSGSLRYRSLEKYCDSSW